MATEKKQLLSLQLKTEDFLPADPSEKESQATMRKSVGFWRDGIRRLSKNKMAMVCLVAILLVFFASFILPMFYPYSYKDQVGGREKLAPMQYSEEELAAKSAGESVFPHFAGTDDLGRDYVARVLVGSRVSLSVGLIAAAIVLVIGAVIGSITGFFGGWVDLIIMRIVDIIYTLPDILIIILMSVVLKAPLKVLSETNAFKWIDKIGANLISIFIVFALLYWVGMARIVRGQIMSLKSQDFVTASRALGASSGHIIKRHLIINCIGTLIVTTTLQIPSAIFTESYLSFVGMGVDAPLPSLGTLAKESLNGFQSMPHRLFVPAIIISVIILSFNLFGDGLRDAFDPKLK